MIEDRSLVIVQLDNLLLLGGDLGYVLPDVVVFLLVIHIDVGEGVVEEVPEYRGGLAVLCEQLLHTLGFCNPCPRTFPFCDQILEFRDQYRRILAFSRRPDDGAVIFRQYALYQGLKPSLLLSRGDFLGYAHLLCEGEEYNVPSCQ